MAGLGLLDVDDLVGQVVELRTVGAVLDELGHLDGPFMVGDHALGKRDVGVVVIAPLVLGRLGVDSPYSST